MYYSIKYKATAVPSFEKIGKAMKNLAYADIYARLREWLVRQQVHRISASAPNMPRLEMN